MYLLRVARSLFPFLIAFIGLLLFLFVLGVISLIPIQHLEVADAIRSDCLRTKFVGITRDGHRVSIYYCEEEEL